MNRDGKIQKFKLSSPVERHDLFETAYVAFAPGFGKLACRESMEDENFSFL